MSSGALILLAIGTPLLGAALIPLFRDSPNQREAVTLATALALFVIVCSIAPLTLSGAAVEARLTAQFSGMSIAFRVEPLGLIFALVASFLWIVTSIYSIGYMRGHHEQNQTRFYACFALALASVMGVAFAGNMLTLFVFYEALTLVTYPLVTHAGTPEAKRAGRVYLGVLLGTSIGFQLLAIIWTRSVTGTLEFRPGGVFPQGAPPALVGLLFALFVFGIGKAAVMPFHRWLPAAMVAPTPVSALLHAVAVVKAGVFSVLKVSVYLFGIDLLATLDVARAVGWAAATTIVLASLVALREDNLKRRLAYSTVSQLSYIVLGATLANAAGVVGGALHIATHAVGKITLFFCAGAIMVACHKTEVSEMRGLGRAMPITMAAFLVGSLSVVGLPPFAGVWSKWYLTLGALAADQAVLAVVLMASSLLSAAYLLPIPIRAFFSPAPEGPTKLREAPTLCVVALSVSALACLLLFLFPGPLLTLAEMIVR